MYRKIEGGRIINIQGLECCLPPVGYVWDILSDKLVYTGVYERSENPLDQYWERFPFPDWYKEVTRQEDDYLKNNKNSDIPFYDERYEEYKRQEWFRRLNGFWLMIKGEPVYLTGFYYYVLQWFRIDIGYVKYITPHLKKTYFLEYCIQDPICFGMIDLTKRRFLKTFLIGAFIIEYITRTKMANGALQSKTGNDAKKVFQKAIVYPFRGMPRFFRPEYDMSLGVNPKTEMRFQNTNVRGKKAEDNLDKEELGSAIDWGSADPLHYDGQKIVRMGQDEWAKTIEANVFDRHEVIRYCLLDEEGQIVGKVLYSSTVEVLDTEKDGVQDAAIQLWEASNQNKRGANGATESGLYRFFQTADEGKNFDKYGEPDIEKTIKDILADRETVKNNARSLAARIRKEPRTVEEAFYAGNDKCEFNAENVYNRIKQLEQEPVYLRQCRLTWKEQIKKNEFTGKEIKEKTVGWMDDEKGGWFVFEKPNKENSFRNFGGNFEPLNTEMYQIGVDTTQDRIAENGSNPVILVFKKSCIVHGEETGLYPVAMWISPTRLDIHFDEEVLKACMWYGCRANYENDRRTDFIFYFNKKQASRFLDWTPKIFQNPNKRGGFKSEIGSRSGDAFQLSQQLSIAKMYIDGTEDEVYNGHVHRIVFPTLLHQLMKYDHNDRTKSDEVVALMMALAPVLGEMQNPIIPQRVRQIIPTFKLKAV